MSDDALLQLQGACARRGEFRLGPVALDVRRGETVGILGANGAGKSTLLALAVGELAPEAGEVSLSGAAPSALSRPEVARRAALLRQRSPPAFAASVLEVVLHGRWAHLRGLRFPGPGDLELARDALERVGAGHLATRDFRTLSGGESQRVLFAKALTQQAPLLLLDEPTANLDLGHAVQVLELSRATAGAGAGVVLVTHELSLAASVVDRAIVLARGRVLAAGDVDHVFRESVLEAAFGVSVRIDPHPDTGRPRVTPRLRGDSGAA